MIVIAMCGALIRLAIPNFIEFTRRASDGAAFAVYDDIKRSLLSLSSSTDGPPPLFLVNQRGEGVLPSPLQRISLSRGIEVNFLFNLHFPGFLEITALQVAHEDGAVAYRLIEVNGKRVEQVVSKEAL